MITSIVRLLHLARQAYTHVQALRHSNIACDPPLLKVLLPLYGLLLLLVLLQLAVSCRLQSP